jgi:hypothetical protein
MVNEDIFGKACDKVQDEKHSVLEGYAKILFICLLRFNVMYCWICVQRL